MSDIISKSLSETRKVAEDFLDLIKFKKSSRAIGLSGNLGSGKTTFVKCVGEILGVKETIQSPTFVLQKSYDTEDKHFQKISHLDLYRISSPKEMEIFNLEEMFKDPKNLILIEWPEKAKFKWPDDMILISFEFIDETTRKISYAI